jgi:hypothetical protein
MLMKSYAGSPIKHYSKVEAPHYEVKEFDGIVKHKRREEAEPTP